VAAADTEEAAGRSVVSKSSSPSVSSQRASQTDAVEPRNDTVSIAHLRERDEDTKRVEAKLRNAARESLSKSKIELSRRWAAVIKSANDESKRRRLGIHGKKVR
jgi:hypothetical protein